jgi:co-chaperonin GroES (HSP10)
MKIIPLNDYLIVEPLEGKNKSASGLEMPESSNTEKKGMGKVIDIDVDLKNKFTSEKEIKIGYIVLFKLYAPNEIKYDGKNMLAVNYDDVIAIIKE